jgi:serine/threonine protein kinase
MKIKNVICLEHRSNYSILEKVTIDSPEKKVCIRKTFSPKNIEELNLDNVDSLRKRFIQEVKRQRVLPEHLFMPILYAELDGESPWFLMPVATKTYNQEIEFCRDRGLKIEGLSDILNSLEHMHNLGMVHRDLKPHNILYHDNKWKLADFGLIKDENKESSAITSTSSNAGTEFYCAPEQVNNFKRATKHADIYSFGAILHDIFNGEDRVPYSRLTAVGQIGFIIEKCTEKDINKRFPDINSLRTMLLGCLSEQSENKNSNKDTKLWISKLKTIGQWKVSDLEQFDFYLKRNRDDWNNIFYSFNPDTLDALFKIDILQTESIILDYFEWVSSRHFGFDYCDVLIGRVVRAYNLSDNMEIKSHAVLAAAELGSHHNRWYVMDNVVKMADSSISELLARRISIEIHIDEGKFAQNLIHCYNDGHHSAGYHSIIQEALEIAAP